MEKVKYASFGNRMMASVIDSVLSLIVLVPLFELMDKVFGLSDMALNLRITTYEEAAERFTQMLPSFAFQNFTIAAVVVVFWVFKSATPGKMLLRMKIVDAKTGGHPSKVQLIVRYLGYFVSTISLCLGFVWIFYDKRSQGFHDKMAGTVVISRR